MVGNSSAKSEVKGHHVKPRIIFASLLLAQVIAVGMDTVFAFPDISGNAEISWNASYPYIKDYNTIDINCDGTLDVVEIAPSVVAFNGSNGAFLWQANIEHSVNDLKVACPYVVVLGEDIYSGGWNITVLNSSDGNKLWERHFAHAGIKAWRSYMRLLDLDGDKKKDAVVVTFKDGSGGVYNYTIYSINIASGSDLWNYSITNATDLTILGLKNLKRYGKPDFNNDGAQDLVVSYEDENTLPHSLVISGSDGSVIWTQDFIWIRSGAADVDGDGVIDLLGYYKMVSGRNGSTIYTFDYAASHAVDDITGDGISDFATFCKVSQTCYDGVFRFRSGADGSVVWSLNLSGAEYASLQVSDNKSKTGIVRAYNSTQGTRLLKVNLSDGSILWEWQINGTRCKATAAGDLNGDGSYDVLCYDSFYSTFMAYEPYSGESSYLAALDGASGTTLWEFVNRTIPLIGDFNGDGKGDIMLGMQSYYDYLDNITITSGDNTSEVIFSFNSVGNVTVRLRDKYLTNLPTLSNDERGVDFTGDGKADLPVLVNPGGNNSEILLLTYSVPDTAPPSITFVSPTPANNSVESGKSIFINITSDESLSSANLYLQLWNGTEWVFPGDITMPIPLSGSNTVWHLNLTAYSHDLILRYWVEAKDLAGNSNTTEMRYATIAGFPPVIYASLGGVAYVPQYTTQFNTLYLFINEGSPDTLRIYRNGSLYKTLSYVGYESFNVSIDSSQAGVWNYTLVANDTFGNVNSTSLLITVTPAEASVEKNITGSPISIDETYTNTSVVLEILPEANAGVLRLNASMSINVSELESNTSNEEFVYALASGQVSLGKFVKIEADARDANGGFIALRYAVISVDYTPEDLDKNGDGNADVNESTLTLWRYCSSNNTWQEIPHGSNYTINCGGENITVFDSGVDVNKHIVWVSLSHLSVFGIAGAVLDSDGDDIPDINDSCPTQAENFNGYQDDDGCPDTKPSAPSGGGGGGGLPENAVEIPKIKAGESHVTVFNDKYVPDIPSIEIFASQDQYYTRISVDTYREKPGWVIFDDAPGKVYRYFKIRYSKPNTYVEKAKITFRVNESWLKAEDIDPSTVMMYRLNEAKQWEKLSTTPEKAGEGYIYYVAETSGFSWFAVTGKKGSGFRDIFAKVEEIKPTSTPAPKPVQEEKPVVTTPPETKPPVAAHKPKPEVKPTPARKPGVEKPEKRGICGPTLVSALAMLAILLRRRKY